MRRFFRKFNTEESGFSLIETVVALGVLTLTVSVFVMGVVISSRLSYKVDERESAENLARSVMEWTKNTGYSYNATSYSGGPVPDVEEFTGFSVNLTAEALHTPDDGIQKIIVTVSRNDSDIVTMEGYKVDR